MKAWGAAAVVAAVLAVALACGSSSDNGGNNNNNGTGNDGGNNNNGNDAGNGATYYIGGAILTAGANGLVLTTAGEPNLQIVAPYVPAWHFANKVPTGTHYDVTVASQPSQANCNGAICTCSVIDGGVGVVGTQDVDTVQIACAIQLP